MIRWRFLQQEDFKDVFKDRTKEKDLSDSAQLASDPSSRATASENADDADDADFREELFATSADATTSAARTAAATTAGAPAPPVSSAAASSGGRMRILY